MAGQKFLLVLLGTVLGTAVDVAQELHAVFNEVRTQDETLARALAAAEIDVRRASKDSLWLRLGAGVISRVQQVAKAEKLSRRAKQALHGVMQAVDGKLQVAIATELRKMKIHFEAHRKEVEICNDKIPGDLLRPLNQLHVIIMSALRQESPSISKLGSYNNFTRQLRGVLAILPDVAHSYIVSVRLKITDLLSVIDPIRTWLRDLAVPVIADEVLKEELGEAFALLLSLRREILTLPPLVRLRVVETDDLVQAAFRTNLTMEEEQRKLKCRTGVHVEAELVPLLVHALKALGESHATSKRLLSKFRENVAIITGCWVIAFHHNASVLLESLVMNSDVDETQAVRIRELLLESLKALYNANRGRADHRNDSVICRTRPDLPIAQALCRSYVDLRVFYSALEVFSMAASQNAVTQVLEDIRRVLNVLGFDEELNLMFTGLDVLREDRMFPPAVTAAMSPVVSLLALPSLFFVLNRRVHSLSGRL